MKTIFNAVLTCGLLAGLAAAQPSVTGVLNTASYALPGLPNGGLAQGGMAAVFGRNLGPTSIAQASSFPLPTGNGLAGTSAKITVGGTTLDCIMVYTLATQLAIIVPSATPLGSGQLTVTYNGQTSAPYTVTVVKNAFGVFTINQAGSGPAVVQNYNSPTDQPVNTIFNSLKPGQTGTIWGTGLAAVSGNEASGALPGDLNVGIEVTVGNKPAIVSYRGRSGCCAGIDQIVFVVPSGITGCYVPLLIRTGNVVSNFTTISIAPNGGVCSDPNGYSQQDLQTALNNGSFRTGTVSLSRSGISLSIPGVGAIESKSDVGSGAFYNYTAQQFTNSSGIGLTAIGTCYIFSFNGTTTPVDPVLPTPLDAGPVINVAGPQGTKQLTRQSTGFYSASFATVTGGIPGLPGLPGGSSTGFLEPGTYTIDNGSGGSGANAVGGFRGTLTIPGNFNWTNKDAVNTIVRANGQNITWTGADASTLVYMSGFSADSAGKLGAGFICTENGNVGQFNIPAAVLLSLPSSGAGGSTQIPTSLMSVGTTAIPNRFTASGLDAGYLSFSSFVGKSVSFQ
jgi:uncharacterized protein (TIGR03437 family)